MESYIEVSFIHQVLMIMVSLCIARVCIFSFFSTRMILYYALMIALTSHLFWFSEGIFIILLVEAICFLTIFKSNKKLYVFAYAIRFLNMLTCYGLYQGSFYHGVYCPPIDAFVYPLWFFWSLFILLCHSIRANHYIEENCIYPVTLSFHQHQLHVNGYLDSANFASHQGRCIVFLDQKYHAFASQCVIEKVNVHTMNADSQIACVCATLQIAHRKEDVYVAFHSQLKLPNACPLLLNMRLLG